MIADLPDLRDRVGIFRDRGHAGRVLARMLEGKLPPGAKLLAILDAHPRAGGTHRG